MARGLMRWPALVGLGILAGSIALYRGGPSLEQVYRRPIPDRRLIVFDSAWRVRRAIDSLELESQDPGLEFARASRGNGLGLVTVDSARRYRAVPITDSVGIDSAWARLPSHDPSTEVLVRLGVSDGVSAARSMHAGRTVCVSSLPGFWAYNKADWDEALGRCGFNAAFGAPGPQIGAWLTVSVIGRETASPSWRPTVDTANWVAQSKRGWAEDSWSLRLLRAGLPESYYDVGESRALTTCAAGVPSTCRAAMLEPIPKRSRYPYWWFEGAGGLGPLSTSILPDLVTQFGPDRFRTFWKSNADVPDAFQDAFGVTMDAWVHQEVVDFYGPLELGAGDIRHAALSALLWALVFLGLTALIARRLRY